MGFSFKNAPEFADSSVVAGQDQKIRLSDYHGQVVWLYFWAVDKLESLDGLSKIVEKASQLTPSPKVIAIHASTDYANYPSHIILEAARMQGYNHPVLIDSQLVNWRNYRASDWPTGVLINSTGQVINSWSDSFWLSKFEEQTLNHSVVTQKKPTKPKTISPKKSENSTTLLNIDIGHPAGIAQHQNGNVFVVDVSRHCLHEYDPNGNKINTFGQAKSGYQNGFLTQAQFNRPRGIAIHQNRIFVSDVGNQCIRCLHLETLQVDTLIGPQQDATCQTNSIIFPTGLSIYKNQLVISDALKNQVFSFNLENQTLKLTAGSGRRNHSSGNLMLASFSEPMGITCQQGKIFVADASNNALRVINSTTLKVHTLAGKGPYMNGYVEGDTRNARFMYPTDVAFWPEKNSLVIADAGNHKIRLLALDTMQTELLWDKIALPLGVCVVNSHVLVSDTLNRCVWQYNPSKPSEAPVLFAGKPLKNKIHTNLIK